MKSIRKKLEIINIFKQPITLNLKGNDEISHWSGLLFTIFIAFLFCFAVVYYGSEFLDRLSFQIVENTNPITKEEQLEIIQKSENNPFVIEISSYIESRVVPVYMHFNPKTSNIYFKIVEKCSEEEVAKIQFSSKSNAFYCFDVNTEGLKGTNLIIVSDCSNSKNFVPALGEGCLDLTDQVKANLDLYYNFVHYPSENIRISSVESPFATVYSKREFLVTSIYYTSYYNTIKTSTVTNDVGWVEQKLEKFYTYYFFPPLLNYSYIQGQVGNVIFNLEVNVIHTDYVRNYQKLIDFLSSIGGLIQGVLGALMLISKGINKQYAQSQIIKCFFTNTYNKNYDTIRQKTMESKSTDARAGIVLEEPRSNRAIRKICTYRKEREYNKNDLDLFKAQILRFACCRRKKEAKFIERVERANYYVKKMMSVEEIVQRNLEFEIIRSIILDSSQINALHFLKRPNIYQDDDILTERCFLAKEETEESLMIKASGFIEYIELLKARRKMKSSDDNILNYLI